MDDLFQGMGVEVELPSPDKFLQVKETLTRMGMADDGRLFQTCHILHKRGRYAIMHFKELFVLDGKEATTTVEPSDVWRRNTIATMLEGWGLIDIVPGQDLSSEVPRDGIDVIPYRDKGSWELVPKYSFGKRKD
jgi:hypothetical protein